MADESDHSGGSGSVIFFGGDERDDLPAQERYGVFHRPAGDDDRAAAGIARADGYVGRGDSLGRPIYGETRLVTGTPQNGMYAFPTTAGAVCTGVIPNGGGGCGQAGPHGLTLGWDDPADGSPDVVYGMAGDDVQALELSVDGAARRVRVFDNAYLLEVPRSAGTGVRRIVLHLRDGMTVPLGE